VCLFVRTFLPLDQILDAVESRLALPIRLAQIRPSSGRTYPANRTCHPHSRVFRPA
jgi:hypothetical protein